MTRILHIDLTSSRTRVEDIAVGDLLGLGGKALGIVLMERFLDPGVDPLGPDNPIILTPSLLAGYAFSGSDRMGIYTKSPLTGAFLDTFSGGTCARTLRETGWEAVVITGAASTPVRLQLDREGATIEPAGDLWGRDVFADGPPPDGRVAQAVVRPGDRPRGRAPLRPGVRTGRAGPRLRARRPGSGLRQQAAEGHHPHLAWSGQAGSRRGHGRHPRSRVPPGQ